MKRISVLLIAAALIFGMIGCGGNGGDGNGDTLPQNLEIYDWYDLDDVRDNLSGNHTLMNDLDSTTAGYEKLTSPTANGGKGWEPIGDGLTGFAGHFDGQGHKICGLFIYRPDAGSVGLFDNVLASGSVRNIGMTNVSVTGKWDTGSLIGTNYGTVDSCYAVGGITGESQPGGLVGLNHVSGVIHDSYFIGIVSNPPLVGSCVGGLAGANEGIVNNCHSIGSVTGIERIGGLIGWNGGTIRNCYSNSSSVGNGGMYVGGLIGDNDYIVSNCYATGSVIGDSCVGGLVGQMGYSGDGVVNNSYSTGSVTGNYAVGGLIGSNNGTASNCYATGNVTGTWSVGGLVGENSKVVTNCYAVGNVTCEYDASGGLVAYNSDVGAVTNSFWDTETSGQATSDGGIGKNTTEMQDITTFSGAAWHIIGVDNPSTRNPFYIWNIVDGETYPFLSWEPVS